MRDNSDLLYYCSFLLFFIKEPLLLNLGAVDFGANIIFVFELLFLVYIIRNPLFRHVLTSKYSILLGVLVIYHCINYATNDVIVFDRKYVMTFRPLIENYIILNLSCFLFLRNVPATLKCVYVSYLLYILLTFNIVSIDRMFDNRLTGLIHANQFAQCAGMGLLLLAFMKYSLRLSYIKVAFLAVVFIAAIIGSGSRNGFLLFVFFLAALTLPKLFANSIDVQRVIQFFIITGIAVVVIYFVLENTGLGSRVMKSDIMSQRGDYYIIGWKNFLEHPLLGIGMWNFGPYNHYPYPLHSEYMIHLCEGGLVGFCIYISFLYLFISSIIKCLKDNMNVFVIVVLLIFIAYMMVGVTARELYYPQFYPPLGLCLYYIIRCKQCTLLQMIKLLENNAFSSMKIGQ